MKETTFLIRPALVTVFFIAASVILFFSGATTIDQADSQAIRELSEEIAEAKSEISAFKSLEADWADSHFVGQIELFAGNFPPKDWAFCDGQLLPVSDNEALFSIIFNRYGGDGRTTFALPDFRGRAPVHAGYGHGLREHTLGEKFGLENSDLKTYKTPVALPSNGNNVTLIGGFDEHTTVQQPSIGLQYIICINGTYPSRS